MIGTIKDRLDAWQRRLTARIGGDISTDQARRAARLHYQLMDHGFLRALWTNFHRIAPQVYRSNQPSERQLRAIHRRVGLRTILNMRGKSKNSFYLFEDETCKKLGITLVDLPMSASEAPSRDKLERLYDLFQTMEKPVLIHCKSGADRTGLAAALYLLLIEGKTVEEAKRQLSFGYLHVAKSPAGIQDHLLRLFQAANRATGVGFMDWVRTDYDPAKVAASFAKWRQGDRSLVYV
jgi:protein tyrosine/serine phosphatase